MKPLAHGLILAAAILLLISSCRSRPSAAEIEVAEATSRFPALAAWIHGDRQSLTQLASDIQDQGQLRRLFWSRPPEYFTVIFRDDTILHGRLRANSWSPEVDALVEEWYSRLSEAGCHGFDDLGREVGLRLYLDVNVFIAIPKSPGLRQQYEAWSTEGQNPRGDVCRSLGGEWYLCSERR
jgi:hypothetical protein